jgi:hypothetical protein
MAYLRRLNPADDPLEPSACVIEDKLDWIYAPGGSPGGRTATANKLGELTA